MPILILVVCWVAHRWADGDSFIVGQSSIAKCIFAVALLEDALIANRLGDEKTK